MGPPESGVHLRHYSPGVHTQQASHSISLKVRPNVAPVFPGFADTPHQTHLHLQSSSDPSRCPSPLQRPPLHPAMPAVLPSTFPDLREPLHDEWRAINFSQHCRGFAPVLSISKKTRSSQKNRHHASGHQHAHQYKHNNWEIKLQLWWDFGGRKKTALPTSTSYINKMTKYYAFLKKPHQLLHYTFMGHAEM